MVKYRIVEDREDDEIVYMVQRFRWNRWRTCRIFLFIPIVFETIDQAERFIRGIGEPKREPKVVREITI